MLATLWRLWYIKHKEGHLLVTGAPIGLPIDGQPGICITKIVAQFSRRGGYFCVLSLSLLPMAYPRPKQVRHKPSTEINPSIVNIRFSPPFPDSLSGFYVNGGSQSLRRGLTAYHPGSPNEILPQIDRNFNRILFSRICGKCFKINLKTISRNKKKDWKSLILRAFQSKCPLFELFPKFLSATLKC